MAAPILSVATPISIESGSTYSAVAVPNNVPNGSHTAFKSELSRASDQANKHKTPSETSDKTSPKAQSEPTAKSTVATKSQTKGDNSVEQGETATKVAVSTNRSNDNAIDSPLARPQHDVEGSDKESINGQVLPYSGGELPQEAILDISGGAINTEQTSLDPQILATGFVRTDQGVQSQINSPLVNVADANATTMEVKEQLTTQRAVQQVLAASTQQVTNNVDTSKSAVYPQSSVSETVGVIPVPRVEPVSTQQVANNVDTSQSAVSSQNSVTESVGVAPVSSQQAGNITGISQSAVSSQNTVTETVGVAAASTQQVGNITGPSQSAISPQNPVIEAVEPASLNTVNASTGEVKGDVIQSNVLRQAPSEPLLVTDKLNAKPAIISNATQSEKPAVVAVENNLTNNTPIKPLSVENAGNVVQAKVVESDTFKTLQPESVALSDQANKSTKASSGTLVDALATAAVNSDTSVPVQDKGLVNNEQSPAPMDNAVLDSAVRVQPVETADINIKAEVQISPELGAVVKQASVGRQEISPNPNNFASAGKVDVPLTGEKAILESTSKSPSDTNSATSDTLKQAVSNTIVAPAVVSASQSEQSLSLNQYLDKMRAGVDAVKPEKNIDELSSSKSTITKLPESLGLLSNLQNSLRTSSPVQMQMPSGTPPTAANWSSAIADKVFIAASQNLRVANIQLDPPELGALQIRLQVTGPDQQLSATFSSPHGAVRDVLEQQLPRLREMLAEQGINLGEASVNDQSADNSRGSDVEERTASGDYADSEEAATEFNPLNSQGTLSLVDFYA